MASRLSSLPRLSRRQLLKTLIELGALIVTPWGLIPNLASAEYFDGLRAAPDSPCSAVDAIRYPTDSLSPIHDDFGIYRPGFAGFHTGVDSQFGSYGAAVYAAARGKVTYADPRGWGTERGVVILQHTFPDGSLVYTLYGHMEPINDRPFPVVGTCVELGDAIGSIGGPLYVAPHLHYEVRRMDGLSGGPGYTSVSPLSQGWLHPLDFTERWKLALNPYFRSALTPSQPPVQPLIPLSDGSVLIAEETQIERLAANNTPIWALALADLQGALLLPDGHLIAVTSAQAYVIDNGQFGAVWPLPATVIPPPIGFSAGGVTFATIDGRLAAYGMDGRARWQTDALGDSIDSNAVSLDGSQIAVCGGQAAGSKLSVIDPQGKIAYQAASPQPIMATPAPDGDGFLILTGTQIGHLGRDFKWRALIDATLPIAAGAQVASDGQGFYLYPGYGESLLAFDAAGHPLWKAAQPPIDPTVAALENRPPRLALGGCAVYLLDAAGQLSAFDRQTGRLLAHTSLYAGGTHGHDAARWLRVIGKTAKLGEQIQFAAGYVSIVTIDAATFIGRNGCG